MKIIRDNKSYIQLKDLEALLRTRCAVPAEIFGAMLQYNGKINEKNKEQFIEFIDKGTAFFLSCDETDWILDLDENYNLSEIDFSTRKSVYAQAVRMMNKSNKYEKRPFLPTIDESVEKYKAKYKLSTLEEIEKLRQGKLKLDLPVEIKKEGPKQLRKNLKHEDI